MHKCLRSKRIDGGRQWWRCPPRDTRERTGAPWSRCRRAAASIWASVSFSSSWPWRHAALLAPLARTRPCGRRTRSCRRYDTAHSARWTRAACSACWAVGPWAWSRWSRQCTRKWRCSTSSWTARACSWDASRTRTSSPRPHLLYNN